MKGPWVLGPWLDSWGSNCKSVKKPHVFTCIFPLFPPCGTMFAWNFFFAGDVAEQGALDRKLTEDRPLIKWILVHRISI